MRNAGKILWIGVLVAGLGGVSKAQVRPVGGGQALDASLQVGSGGINYAVPQNYTPNTGMSSLTQSRGLTRFMGHAPTLSNQITVGVSTGGVDRFRQQSVGVRAAVRGGPSLYNPQYSTYNSQLTTFLRPSDIVKANYGRRVPLPGASPASKSTKLAENLYVDATAKYKPIMPTDVDETMVGRALSLPSTQTQEKSDALWSRALDSHQLADRGGKDLFGMLHQQDRANLAQQISDFDKANEADPALNLAVQPTRQIEPVQPIDARQKQINFAEKLEGPGAIQPTPPTENAAQPQTPNLPQVDFQTGLPKENSDPYFDMLVQLRQQQLGQNTEDTEDGEKKGKEGKGKTPSNRQAMNEALALRLQAAIRSPSKERSVTLSDKNQVILHRLAGESDDTFNRYMRRAESALKAGRYYEAIRQYNLATMVRPTNPMARLGACLANFAADEWLTSAQNLRTAMELFPPLMETRPNLSELLPVKDWPQRLAMMEQWVEKVEERPMMLFLATFMQFNQGNKELAKQHAEAIQKLDQIPWILKAYAQYVLTGKLPAKAKPRRRPAEK